MLGRQGRQLSLTDLFWRERIRRDHFAWRLDDFCRAIDLREEDFASMFASGGRPSVSPVVTLRAVIYQLESGLSDVEIEEGSAFDDRVKLALGMRRNDPPLDAVTLCRHRKRFVEENEGWAILQQSLKLAGRAGLLDEGGTQIIDSFNLKEGWVRCPAGEVTSRAHRGKDDKKRPVLRYPFAAETCAACSLRAQCTTNPAGRTVGLHYYENVLQAARAEQKTEAFAELYPTRTRVEHVIARMTRHGGRHARMLGQVKTLFQQQIVAAANNIKQLARLGGLPRPAPLTKG